MNKKLIGCFVFLFFGILISSLAFLRIRDRKKGFERAIRANERWVGLLRKNNPLLAIVFAVLSGLWGIWNIVTWLFFPDQTRVFPVAGAFVLIFSFFVIRNCKSGFFVAAQIDIAQRQTEFLRKNPEKALIYAIVWGLLGILLIAVAVYSFTQL